MFGRPLGLMHYSRSVNPRKCAVRGERLSRHDYGRSIHNLRLTGGGEYAMPCGRESPWGCEPRLLHFFFRRSTAERLAEKSQDGMFSAADFRDATDIGRNVTIQVLEYFDRSGFTQRVGEGHVEDLAAGAREHIRVCCRF